MTANVASEVRLLLTPRDAAKALSVSERTLWTLTRGGEIAYIKVGRLVRYSIDDLRAFIASRKTNAATKDVQ